MQLTIHRGTHEIGGSCVELRTANSRIVIDIGMPLVNPDGSEFDQRAHEGLSGKELVERGILPRIEGLYAWDEPRVDGLLISHAHQDHYGFLGYVHQDIPVYMGEGTQRLMKITTQFSPSELTIHNPIVFVWPGEFTVGGFRVVPHLVDHSAFGAFSFEIEAGGKRVFYSGDFRGHGPIPKTLDLIERYATKEVDALLLEGTMLGREEEEVMTEAELAQRATEICRACSKAVLVYQSGQNVSRTIAFYKAARGSGRELVLDVYTAHVMSELRTCRGGEKFPAPGAMEGVKVWYPYHLNNRLLKGDDETKAISYRHAKYKMDKTALSNNLDKVVLFVRPGMEGDLHYIQGIEGSHLIYSLWEGYRETIRAARFLKSVSDLGITEESLHTSGHATRKDLRRLIDATRPKTLIPIHTFHPDRYRELYDGHITQLSDGQMLEI